MSRCLALTKAGDQCQRQAKDGRDYCPVHGPTAQRARKLTDGVIRALEEGARAGLYRVELARLAGVDERTLYRWLEAAAADEEAGNTDSLHARLRHALTRAEAEAEESMLALVRDAATIRTVLDRKGDAVEVDGDWRAAAWFLERRYPSKYGRRDHVTVNDPSRPDAGKPVTITPESDERRAELVSLLNRAGALSTGGDPE